MATTTKSRRRKTIEAVVTVTKFTDSTRPFTIVRPETSLKEFNPIHGGDYLAKGYNTPLRDGVAKFIAHLETLQRPDRVVIGVLADESGSMSGNEPGVIQGTNDFVKGMAEVKKIDPDTAGDVIAVISTDGLENASREISLEALHAIVATKEQEGWTFIFLGAQIDAWGTGISTLGLSGGITGQTVSAVNTSHGHYAAMANVTTDSASYLGNKAAYKTNRAGSTMRSVTDTGVESLSNINASGSSAVPPAWTPGAPVAQPNVTVQNNMTFNSPYADVEDALKKAKEKTS